MRSSRSSRSKRSDCARRQPRRPGSGDRTMRFMIVVKASQDSEAGVMPHEKILGEMAKYHEELQKAGVLLDASGLQATSKGWRIQYSGQKRTVVDGPFSEAKELIAGYTIIQVKSREEAMEWARRFPNPSTARRPRSKSGSSSSWRILVRARRSSAFARWKSERRSNRELRRKGEIL